MAADYGLLGNGFSVANALAMQGLGRQQGRQQMEYERQEQLRRGLQAAYDPTTGQLDRVAARTAYAGAGDIQGAMAVDQRDAAAQKAQYETALNRVNLTAQLLGGVRDEATYQQARQVAQQNGLDVSGIPPRYDPTWVQQTRTQAMTIQQQLQEQRDRWVPIGERGLLNVSDPAAVAEFKQDQSRRLTAPSADLPAGFTLDAGGPTQPASGRFP